MTKLIEETYLVGNEEIFLVDVDTFVHKSVF